MQSQESTKLTISSWNKKFQHAVCPGVPVHLSMSGQTLTETGLVQTKASGTAHYSVTYLRPGLVVLEYRFIPYSERGLPNHDRAWSLIFSGVSVDDLILDDILPQDIMLVDATNLPSLEQVTQKMADSMQLLNVDVSVACHELGILHTYWPFQSLVKGQSHVISLIKTDYE